MFVIVMWECELMQKLLSDSKNFRCEKAQKGRESVCWCRKLKFHGSSSNHGRRTKKKATENIKE